MFSYYTTVLLFQNWYMLGGSQKRVFRGNWSGYLQTGCWAQWTQW